MPRNPLNPHRNSIRFPESVWAELQEEFSRAATERLDDHAVLMGVQDGATTIVHLAVADREDEARRAQKRRAAASQDLDVVGQVHLTHEDLDLTLSRSAEEQLGRRQTRYSLPNGFVFLHVHHIGLHNLVCAHVAREGDLEPMGFVITDNELVSREVSSRSQRRKSLGNESIPPVEPALDPDTEAPR